MNETKQRPPRDDAELAERVEAATRPSAWAPSDSARFRAGVEARIAPESRARLYWVLGLTASAAAAALLLAPGSPAPAPAALPAPTIDVLAESYEEQVLFAPEWLERDAGFVDADVLPEDYALASALIES